jgi:hypothetical protein
MAKSVLFTGKGLVAPFAVAGAVAAVVLLYTFVSAFVIGYNAAKKLVLLAVLHFSGLGFT